MMSTSKLYDDICNTSDATERMSLLNAFFSMCWWRGVRDGLWWGMALGILIMTVLNIAGPWCFRLFFR